MMDMTLTTPLQHILYPTKKGSQPWIKHDGKLGTLISTYQLADPLARHHSNRPIPASHVCGSKVMILFVQPLVFSQQPSHLAAYPIMPSLVATTMPILFTSMLLKRLQTLHMIFIHFHLVTFGWKIPD